MYTLQMQKAYTANYQTDKNKRFRLVVNHLIYPIRCIDVNGNFLLKHFVQKLRKFIKILLSWI